MLAARCGGRAGTGYRRVIHSAHDPDGRSAAWSRGAPETSDAAVSQPGETSRSQHGHGSQRRSDALRRTALHSASWAGLTAQNRHRTIPEPLAFWRGLCPGVLWRCPS